MCIHISLRPKDLLNNLLHFYPLIYEKLHPIAKKKIKIHYLTKILPSTLSPIFFSYLSLLSLSESNFSLFLGYSLNKPLIYSPFFLKSFTFFSKHNYYDFTFSTSCCDVPLLSCFCFCFCFFSSMIIFCFFSSMII